MAYAGDPTFPLTPATIAGTTYTVDWLLQTPTRVTWYLSNIALQNFVSGYFLNNAGGVSGGSVIYDPVSINDLYPLRDVQQIMPGSDIPILTTDRQAPLTASVVTWAGKFSITDEARRRNDITLFNREATKVQNAFLRKFDQQIIALVNASVTASAHTFVGKNWSTAVTYGSAATANQNLPVADFSAATLLQAQYELGFSFDTFIGNPVQEAALINTYGPGYAQVFSALGYTMVWSNRVPVNTGYFVSRGNVGEWRVEAPLATEVVRDAHKRQTWCISSASVVGYVINPYAVATVTNLAG